MTHYRDIGNPGDFNFVAMTENEELAVYKAVKAGETRKSIGKKFGLKPETISAIFNEQVFLKERPRLARSIKRQSEQAFRCASYLWNKGYSIEIRKKG